MLALVTRPREDAEGIAAELAARGFSVMVEPLIDIRPVDGARVDLAGVQGILATSANGIRALARVSAERALPVWAVGDASARRARELGYRMVESARGDVETLAALVRRRVDPGRGALLHAAGTKVAGDLGGLLAASGHEVRRVVLYEARPVEALSEDCARALGEERVGLSVFFSPRTAATFVTLARRAGVAAGCRASVAYALSPAVAGRLSPLPWKAVRVAERPEQAALLAAVDANPPNGRSPSGPGTPTTRLDCP